MKAFPALAALSLAGCATAPGPDIMSVAKPAISQPTPVCVDSADCAAKWDAAQVWVVKNADMKIQTATSAIIETYNPMRDGAADRMAIAVMVTKEPMGDGHYKIVIAPYCANRYGCRVSLADFRDNFNQYVGSVH